jgi:hypothetical protein
MPRRAGHPYLCAFHARKEAQALAGQEAGQEIAYHLSGSYVSACDLTSALGRLFSAVAQGQMKPKTASTLAYLGQTLVQTLHLAQNEYINAFGTNSWRETIRTSHNQSADHVPPAPNHRQPTLSPRPPQPRPHLLPQNKTGPLSSFRMNTCKSVSKQRTLSSFRINTYAKTGGGGLDPRWVRTGHIPDRIDREHP